ncbi:hypothetical protein MLDJOKPK_00081 [Salmonella phage SPAsTU]|nr:hypothetical protein STsAS_061 [Salmonella phage STsAS]AWN09022.1 hypothetical protein MLDJOKPK_00081 [Salmonella phage SPAsTU]
MSISVEQITKVIVNQLNRDQTLTELNNVMKKLNMAPEQALKIATLVAEYARQKGGSEDQIVAYAVDAYKATVYQQMQRSGNQYNDDRHTRLTKAWEEVSNILQQVRKAQENSLGGNAGGLLGGGSSSGGIRVTDGLTLSNQPSGGVRVGGTGNGISVIAPSAEIDLVNDPLLSPQTTTQPAAPQQQAPAPITVEVPQTASQLEPTRQFNVPVNDTLGAAISERQPANTNSPVNNILQEIDVEDYKLHELKTPEAKMTIPAKEANSRIKQSVFAETRDWASPLQDLFNGKEEVVFYQGADLIVRARDSYRAYLVGVNKDMQDKVRQFVAKHDALKGELDDLYAIDDVERLITKVQNILTDMRKNTISLHDYAVENSDESEVVVSEVARFANAYMANITLLVHNALALGTNRGTEVPTINGTIELERAPDDITFFAKDLFAATAGDNGVSEHEDWFRDLFLMVATSLRKLTIKLSDSASTINLIQSLITIVVPGLYNSVEKHDVVTVASLGNTADPVVSIYEAILEEQPHVQVMMQLPQQTYLLLSNGEKTAAVHY